jgi:Mrp family chromosome partitioning ATPase
MHSKSKAVPNRRGSEYIDVLLRNLDSQILNSSRSVVIGMAACESKQGLTTTSINLAIRCADHSMGPVLLIDANAKNGKLSRMYRTHRIGYGECISGKANIGDAVTPTKIESLDILGVGDRRMAGQIVPEHALAEEFFGQVRDQYQITIVDMPIFQNPSPAQALSRYVDGVVVVARSGVHNNRLAEMQQSISSSNHNLLGVVVTGGEGNVLPRWLQRLFE